jgi:hypothetical protein
MPTSSVSNLSNDEALTAFLRERVALHAGLDLASVDADTPIYRFGLDSRVLMAIVEEAESAFARAADLERISPADPVRSIAAALIPL